MGIDDNLPLRGIVKCHCGNPLSGAPSKGKGGRWYYYYKCRFSKHNNISAIKAHDQFLGACELMSLPEKDLKKLRLECEAALEKQLVNNREKASEKKLELEQVQEKLFQLEEKWISDAITRDTYDRWFSTYNNAVITLKGAIGIATFFRRVFLSSYVYLVKI